MFGVANIITVAAVTDGIETPNLTNENIKWGEVAFKTTERFAE